MNRSAPIVFTVVAKNYLAHARVLMRSVAEHSPEARRVVFLVDSPEGCFDPALEPFEVVSSAELPIPRSRWFHFKYTILELATGVKPFAFEWLWHRYQPANIVYFDPDIVLFGALEPMLAPLRTANLILTPHLTRELDAKGQPDEIAILKAGAYNLGFLALATTSESRRFLRWWQERLYGQCVVDTANGLFVDQKWLDLAPGLFEGVHVDRNEGRNVAYWNLPHRTVTRRADGYLVNGEPLLFFHFSGFDPDRAGEMSRHQNRLRLADLGPEGAQLFAEYSERLFRAGFAACRNWRYSNGWFANGLPVPDCGRSLCRELPQLEERIEDPFSDAGFDEIRSAWNAPVRSLSGQESGISRLALRIYQTRADVRVAMPDILGTDRLRFLEWLVTAGRQEHALFDAVLEPAAAALRSGPAFRPADSEAGSTGRLSTLHSVIDHLLLSRPDLRRTFPDPFGRDAAAFCVWLSTYGRLEYAALDSLHDVLREQQLELLARKPLAERLRLRAWAVRMRLSAQIGKQLRSATSPEGIPQTGEVAQGANVARTAALRRTAAAEAATWSLGVNLIGYLRTQNGVGQSARNAVQALESAGVPYRLENIRAHGLEEADHALHDSDGAGGHHGINLFVVNADQTSIVAIDTAELRNPGRHNVATWVWELPALPAEWDSAYSAYDEIWVPSTYCQKAIAARSPVPVVHVPYVVTLPKASRLGRADFRMEPGAFVFLAVFDMRSVFERKNPLGVVAAFAQAFRPEDDCELVIKVNHADAAPDKMELLRRAAAGLRIRILDETYPHPDVVALMQAADCIVSLHRAEGFGFVMAEGMLLEKPVIATAYSGNMDFTFPGNSFLVDYSLRQVGPGAEPYDPTACWAEPSEGDAVAQMRLVYREAALRRQRAEAGARFVREHFSADAIGARYKERLEWIAARNGYRRVPVQALEMAK